MCSPIVKSALLSVILVASCTQTKFPPPSPGLRSQLGPTAVVAMPAKPALDLGSKPVSGSGAGALLGAGEGASAGLVVAAGGCGTADSLSCAIGLVLGAAVAVVAAPVGAVAGAISAHSAEEVRLADANLHTALTNAQTTATSELRDRVVAAAHGLAPYRITAYSPTSGSAPPGILAGTGFNTRLEIAVSALKLAVVGKIDPNATLVIVAEGRFVHVASGAELYRRTWAYLGRTQGYFKEAGENAQLMRADIDAGLDKLAGKIVSDLFVSDTPEPQTTSAEPGSAYTLGAWAAANTGAPPQSQVPGPTGNSGTGTASSATGPSPSAAGKTATPSISPGASGPVDVPFRIDYGAGVVVGVAKLENGQLAGQASLGGRPITIAGSLKDRKLSVDVYGAIISPSLAQTGSGIGYYCSGSAELDNAVGKVKLPLTAACGTENIHDTVYFELPSA